MSGIVGEKGVRRCGERSLKIGEAMGSGQYRNSCDSWSHARLGNNWDSSSRRRRKRILSNIYDSSNHDSTVRAWDVSVDIGTVGRVSNLRLEVLFGSFCHVDDLSD